jgi:hypothetical protein
MASGKAPHGSFRMTERDSAHFIARTCQYKITPITSSQKEEIVFRLDISWFWSEEARVHHGRSEQTQEFPIVPILVIFVPYIKTLVPY